MNKTDFTTQMRALSHYQDRTFKLEDILGNGISTESFIGDLVNSYGDLILNTAANGKEIPDGIFEKFWNLVIVNPEELYDEDIEELYEEIMSL